MTGTRFRRYERKDPEFAAKVEEAKAEGKSHLLDRLRDRLEDLALNVNSPSERLLMLLAEAHLPEFAYKRQRQVKHEGEVRHTLTTEQLDAIPVEKLERLVALMDELGLEELPAPERLRVIEGGR